METIIIAGGEPHSYWQMRAHHTKLHLLSTKDTALRCVYEQLIVHQENMARLPGPLGKASSLEERASAFRRRRPEGARG